MLLGQRNKDGAACVRGMALSKPVEWLQAGALGPREALPPPWQGRLHQYSTSRAGEALDDSHCLTNLKVSCFSCKSGKLRESLKNQGMELSPSRIFLPLGRLLRQILLLIGL